MSESVRSPHRHNVVYPSTRPKCPVCNTATFSPGGIHPQCSVNREAGEFEAARKAERKAAELAGVIPERKPSMWHRPQDRPPVK